MGATPADEQATDEVVPVSVTFGSGVIRVTQSSPYPAHGQESALGSRFRAIDD